MERFQLSEQLLGDLDVLLGFYSPSDTRAIPKIEHDVSIEEYPASTPGSVRWRRALLVAHEVYRQQKQMYDQRGHSVPDRIVSVSQSHVRPIVHGKAGAPVEFGAKILVSKVGRFAFLDRLSWDSYDETADLKPVVEHYRERYGCYPESVHVDAICRTRRRRSDRRMRTSETA